MPPQAVDLEEAILGALMLEKDAYIEVSDFLRPECFYKEAHQKIYQAIQTLSINSEPVDILPQPIPLDVGSSYINVVASSAEVFWE